VIKDMLARLLLVCLRSTPLLFP